MVTHANAGARGLQALLRLLWVLALTLLGVPPGTRAQTEEQAQASFQEGVEASRAERWLEARAAFLRSLAWAERSSTFYNLALSELKLGLGLEALQHLEAFEKVAAPAERPELWERAVRLRQRAALVAGRPSVAGSEPIVVEELATAQREDLAAGRRAYARGQDALALEAFEAAHHDSGRGELLFNVGLAADRLRFDERALRAYERFVAELPDLPQATHARARIALLRASLAERNLAGATGAAQAATTMIERSLSPPAQVTHPDQRPLALPCALLIGGALASGGAVAAGFWWRGRRGALHTCDGNPLCDNGSELERQRRGAIATTVALGAIAFGLATSGALWLVRGKRALVAKRAPAVRAALAPSSVLAF